MSQPVYYNIEEKPTPDDFLSPTFIGALDAFLAQLIGGTASSETLQFFVKTVGIASVAAYAVEVSKEDDGFLIEGVKVAADFTAGQLTTHIVSLVAQAVAEAVLSSIAGPTLGVAVASVATGAAAAYVWSTIDETIGLQSKLDALLGSEDVDMRYNVGGNDVAGVLYDTLAENEYSGALLGISDWANAEPNTKFDIYRNGTLKSSYNVFSGNIIKSIAEAMNVSETVFSGWDWAQDAEGHAASNGTIVVINNQRELSIVDQASQFALKVLSADGQQMEMLSVAVKDIGIGGTPMGSGGEISVIIGNTLSGTEHLNAGIGGRAYIIGGAGNDILTGGGGDDRLFGDNIEVARFV